MKILVLKKYFLDIKEREQLEQELIVKNPELIKLVLEWDDEELLERINNKKETLKRLPNHKGTFLVFMIDME